MTTGHTSGAVRSGQRRRKTVTGSSRSGTTSSCRTNSSPTGDWCRWRCSRSTPAWGWNGSVRFCRASTTTFDTDLMRSLIEASAPMPPAQDPDGPGQDPPPGDRGSPPVDLVPHRRRGDAVERRPGLCPAPHHAPRDAPCAYVGRAGSGDAPAGARTRARDGCGAYPELGRAQSLIEETLRLEETRFKPDARPWLAACWTMSCQPPRLKVARCRVRRRSSFTTPTAFPLDLTQDALREKGREVDVQGFDAAMAGTEGKRRERPGPAPGATADSKVWFEIAEEHGVTEFLRL